MFCGGGGASMGMHQALKDANIYHEIVGYDIRDMPDYPFIFKKVDVFSLKLGYLKTFDFIWSSPPCLVAKELILTNEGDKPIERIEIGDKVLTHNGNYKKVVNIMERKYSGKLYKIYLKYFPFPLICTEEHPILYIIRKKIWDNSRRKYKFLFLKGFSKFIEAKYIKQDYLIGFPLNKKEEMFERWIIKRKINKYKIVEESIDLPFKDIKFWFFIGYYLAEGWYRDDRKEVNLAVGDHEIETIKKLINRFPFNISAISNVEGKSSKVTIYNLHLWNFVKIFKKGAPNKIIPKIIEDLPKKYLKALLMGWVFGDGYYDKNKTFVGVTTSFSMVKSFQRIGLKIFGYLPSLTTFKPPEKTVIEGRIVNQRRIYNIRFNNRRDRYKLTFKTRDHIFVKVKKIEVKTVENINVYNFEVKDDNSYCKHLFATHNCQMFTSINNMNKKLGRCSDWINLIPETRSLLLQLNKPFVLENVPKAPLRRDLMLCGTMFNLGVFRHRIFEIHGFVCYQPIHPKHRGFIGDGKYFQVVRGPMFKNKQFQKKHHNFEKWKEAMDIDWISIPHTKELPKGHPLAEAIPPVYSKFIMNEFLRKHPTILDFINEKQIKV